jgi:predicted small secreted protein
MKTLTRKVVLLAMLAMGMLAFSGCHTAHGFGQDVQQTGKKIEQSTE